MSQGVVPPPGHPVRAALHQVVGPAEKSTQCIVWSMSDAPHPPWIGPDRTPRQHHPYRIRQLAAGPDPPWD